MTTVWSCSDPAQADALLAGKMEGYVYQRDGHPNADSLAEKCRQLHVADQACVVASGMSAISAALLAVCQTGEAIAASNQLYGRSLLLLKEEADRFGIACHVFDPLCQASTGQMLEQQPRLVVVETIANPMLRVVAIDQLANACHAQDALLLVDNTFASPVVCQPLELGADLVVESLTKSMNGHSDVVMGLIAGRKECFERVPIVVTTWGFNPAPMECWLAERGLTTLALRAKTACTNAFHIAKWLSQQPQVETVHYPGLSGHPDHEVAERQFAGLFGSMITFQLRGNNDELGSAFIKRLTTIPFCPSLGEAGTTISHPASTSHRGLTVEERKSLGISDNTLRLSVGIESSEYIISGLQQAWT